MDAAAEQPGRSASVAGGRGDASSAPKLADQLEKNVPEADVVFTLPERHCKRMRTSHPIERAVQQELKRRTVKVGECLLRLVSAMLVEIDEKLDSDTKVSGCLTRSQQNFQTTGCSIHTAPLRQAP